MYKNNSFRTMALGFLTGTFLISCGGGGSGEAGDGNGNGNGGSNSDPTPTPDPTGQWELVWEDDFNDNSINMQKWQLSNSCWDAGDGQKQCYTSNSTNAFVQSGLLNLVALQEQLQGASLPETDSNYPGDLVTRNYSSAKIHTRGMVDWSYGRFEINAKLPEGQGLWSAIKLLPSNSPYGGWPASGEIDLVEAVNLKATVTQADAENSNLVSAGQAESRIVSTLHYGRVVPENKMSGADYVISGANPADGFHVYALEWEDGEIRWYVDNVHYATQREDGWYSQYMDGQTMVDAPIGAPFDAASPFHLVMNLAVGGSWPEQTNETGINADFPQALQIDYVRVYRCNASPSTGAGCAMIGDNALLVDGEDRPALGNWFANLPLYPIFMDSLNQGLQIGYYNEQYISITETTENNRGTIVNIAKTNIEANVFFEISAGAQDFSNWMEDGDLVFDLRVNSNPGDSELWVKMDSGWPRTSDWVVPLPTMGTWSEVRIPIADLVTNGNHVPLYGGYTASITNILMPLVIEPRGIMNISLDNIRYEDN